MVILNGHPTSRGEYDPSLDGIVELGRDIEVKGAHCKGFNSRSIGVCLIGKETFTENQMETLTQVLLEILQHYGLDADAVYGHNELDDHKTCPNQEVAEIRDRLWNLMS